MTLFLIVLGVVIFTIYAIYNIKKWFGYFSSLEKKNVWVGFQYFHLENLLFRSWRREGKKKKREWKKGEVWYGLMSWQTRNKTQTYWRNKIEHHCWCNTCTLSPKEENWLVSTSMHMAWQYFSFPEVKFKRWLWKGKAGQITFKLSNF